MDSLSLKKAAPLSRISVVGLLHCSPPSVDLLTRTELVARVASNEIDIWYTSPFAAKVTQGSLARS